MSYGWRCNLKAQVRQLVWHCTIGCAHERELREVHFPLVTETAKSSFVVYFLSRSSSLCRWKLCGDAAGSAKWFIFLQHHNDVTIRRHCHQFPSESSQGSLSSDRSHSTNRVIFGKFRKIYCWETQKPRYKSYVKPRCAWQFMTRCIQLIASDQERNFKIWQQREFIVRTHDHMIMVALQIKFAIQIIQ